MADFHRCAARSSSGDDDHGGDQNDGRNDDDGACKIEVDPEQPKLIKTVHNKGYVFTPEVVGSAVLQLQEWLLREGLTYPAMPMDGAQPNYFTIIPPPTRSR